MKTKINGLRTRVVKSVAMYTEEDRGREGRREARVPARQTRLPWVGIVTVMNGHMGFTCSDSNRTELSP